MKGFCSSPGHGAQEGPTSGDLLQEAEVLAARADQGEGQGGRYLELFRVHIGLATWTKALEKGLKSITFKSY